MPPWSCTNRSSKGYTSNYFGYFSRKEWNENGVSESRTESTELKQTDEATETWANLKNILGKKCHTYELTCFQNPDASWILDRRTQTGSWDGSGRCRRHRSESVWLLIPNADLSPASGIPSCESQTRTYGCLMSRHNGYQDRHNHPVSIKLEDWELQMSPDLSYR